MKKGLSEPGLYFRYLRVHLLSALEYKGWWMMLLQTMIVVVTDPISTVLLFWRFGALGEWGIERMLLVYALAVTAFGCAECLFRGFDYFPWHMLRTGEFDRLLLRPRSLFLQVSISFFHLHRLARPITGLCVIVWALARLQVRLTLPGVLMLVCALLGGTILYCGTFVLTSGLSIFTIKGLDWIYVLTNASYAVTRCPEPYLPRALKAAFSFLLPVLFVSFYPAAAICGWGYPMWLGWLALPMGSLFLGLSLMVWRVGVRHYRSTGS